MMYAICKINAIMPWHAICTSNIYATYAGIRIAICKIYANITGPYIAIAQSMPEHDKNEHIYFPKS